MRHQTLFDPIARQRIVQRVESLSPDSPRGWGTMGVGATLAHLSDQLRFATSELTPLGPKGPLTWRFFQWFGIVVMPWPKGRIETSPELLQTPPGEFALERAELIRLVDAFARTPIHELGPHPMFGALPPRLWGSLAWRHLDHHLRQFGA